MLAGGRQVRLQARLTDLFRSTVEGAPQDDELYAIGTDKRTVSVALLVGATTRTELKAFVHSQLLKECLGQSHNNLSSTVLLDRTWQYVCELFSKMIV